MFICSLLSVAECVEYVAIKFSVPSAHHWLQTSVLMVGMETMIIHHLSNGKNIFVLKQSLYMQYLGTYVNGWSSQRLYTNGFASGKIR